MNIISKINNFYKQAKSQADLSKLLANSLQTGDKTDYLIFLDLLEETFPNYKELYNAATDLKTTLTYLSNTCRDVISSDGLNLEFTFKTPTFGSFKKIGFRGVHNINYEHFDFIFRKSGFRRVLFDALKGPSINEQHILAITDDVAGVRILSTFGAHFEGEKDKEWLSIC